MSDGRNRFDRTHIQSVVQAHVRAAHALVSAPLRTRSLSIIPPEERVDGEAFLINNDESVRFWEFARALGDAAGYPMPPEGVSVVPKWLGLIVVALMESAVWISSHGKRDSSVMSAGIGYSMMDRTYNIDKAKKRLGYRPTADVDKGIRSVGESFKKDKKGA